MIYSKIYEPRISDYTKNGKLALHSIINILEDITAHHSVSVNDNFIENSKNGLSWISVEWNVIIHKYPKTSEALYIDTWATGTKVSYVTYREFLVKDKQGNVYINACEKLTMLDINAGKIIRITPEMISMYEPEESVKYNFDFSKLQQPQKYDYSKPIYVRRTDIDYNNHVHNTKYLEYAIEAIPEKAYEEDGIKEFRIIYKKPVIVSDNITLNYTAADNGHIISIFKEDNELCTLIQFK